MRLFALYNVFNAPELLPYSIRQIEPYCAEIVLCYQQASNFGQNKNVHKEIKPLLSEKIVALEYKPSHDVEPVRNNIAKLQMRIEYARDNGADYFFYAAEDHFYDSEEFGRGLNDVVRNGYDSSATQMDTYYKHPTWKLTPPEDYWMPFIYKMRPDTKVEQGGKYPVRVDPGVKVFPTGNFKAFSREEVTMHHYSMVRKDIRLKLSNSAASNNWRPTIDKKIREVMDYDIEKNPGVKYFQRRKIEIVKNKFNIPQWQQ